MGTGVHWRREVENTTDQSKRTATVLGLDAVWRSGVLIQYWLDPFITYASFSLSDLSCVVMPLFTFHVSESVQFSEECLVQKKKEKKRGKEKKNWFSFSCSATVSIVRGCKQHLPDTGHFNKSLGGDMDEVESDMKDDEQNVTRNWSWRPGFI